MMRKLVAFEILFAKKPPIFFSGRSVDGIVVVHVSQDIEIRSIRVRIYGEANTCIRMRNGNPFINHGNGTVAIQPGGGYCYNEKEVYLDRSINLWGNNEGQTNGNDAFLPAGRHEFEFNFSLSAEVRIPSSFSLLSQCSIRYVVIASIDRTGKSPRIIKRPIALLESISIDRPALIQPPCLKENETILCCCCCQSGPIKLRAGIDRSGYCPGEKIIIDAECENLSSRRLSSIRITLIRHVHWKAKGIHCYRSFICYETQSNQSIGPQETYKWNDRLSALPALPPTIKSCRFISVTYQLKATVVIPYDENIQVTFPVVIGTVSARLQDRYAQNLQEIDSNLCPEPSSSTITEAENAYLALPPPSYEECVNNSVDLSQVDDSSFIIEDESSSIPTEVAL
ncbi:uncharacterized protein TRIADDRAFT_59959 [Trichoplax adhaerens]|uniref:Arrestin C-terminal-like domain-containing protein n=1 Tax=Trichoplax adhaerens TaxID=10228 RepID=B3S6X0_TRIAD|nr:hypothetical protein TRIADDRAFT_59959 [Trichoplax adhaerens]EDV21467.1 hypothetical protein TRIADDRAFT_59959 [Trichoplax adhaerens]|eukprot:XP_002116067.1 hypothetical protein TRIADDRAFT_59959 [Trichoplax adhaerens]